MTVTFVIGTPFSGDYAFDTPLGEVSKIRTSADLLLENRVLKDVIAKSCKAGGQTRTGGGIATRTWTQRRARLRGRELEEISLSLLLPTEPRRRVG
jgi:hypothetical protein